MRSLTHNPISITHSGDEFVISQSVGETADDVVTIKISEDQARQIAKFLSGSNAGSESAQSDSHELSNGWVEFWSEYPRKGSRIRALEETASSRAARGGDEPLARNQGDGSVDKGWREVCPPCRHVSQPEALPR